MRPTVRAAFLTFTSPLEGVVPFCYLDVKGLVTIAVGNLIDPVDLALGLPFLRKDGKPASRGEVLAEWKAIKARRDLAPRGGMAFEKIATLHLSPEGIERVVLGKLADVDARLARRFPQYETWPADAQLGVLSMAWACGAHFHFPLFEAAVRALDFTTAAVECRMNEQGNPGLHPRNVHNKTLFENAAAVLAAGDDPSVLHWPARFGGPEAA